MKTTEWQNREKRLESGKIVRWRERDLGNGEVERIYEDGETRTSAPQPANVRDT
jgi:hypothetical protein